jgi:hypothetical protein
VTRPHLSPAALGRNPSKGDVVLAVLGSFVLAAVSSAVVERPRHKNEKRVARPLWGLSLGAVTGISVLCAVLAMSLAVLPGAGAATAETPSTGAATSALLVSADPSVAQSIAAATHLEALPPNLSPPLTEVPNDTPYTCIDTPSASAPQSVCTLGDQSATRTVALFGDSHAWQWTQALAAVASQRDWKLVAYTKGGCPIYDVSAAVPASVVGSTNCTQWRAAVIAQLSTLRPALVIMSSQTKGFGTAKDMTETVNAVKADGSKVVWLEDTPSPGSNVPDCLSVHPTAIQKCAFSLTAGLYEPQTRTALNQAAARDGATLINPAPWLCTARVCPPVIGSTVTYFDDSHLSSTYAMMLVPELSSALAASMPLAATAG